MKKFLGLALLACLTAHAELPPRPPEIQARPDYQKLKTYRTYYAIKSYSGPKHNFAAWYRVGKYVEMLKMNIATPEQASKEWIGVRGPVLAVLHPNFPEKFPYEPVPAGLEHLTAAIEKRVVGEKPEAKDFVFRWIGEYRNFSLEEFIPVTNGPDVFERSAKRGVYDLRMPVNSNKIESDFGQNGSGTTSLCRWWAGNNCAEDPIFLDFSMPQALEGTSPIASEFYDTYRKDRSPAYEPVMAQLGNLIARVGPLFEAGKLKTALPRVLARQGNSVLPPGFEQWIEYSFDFYAYPKRDPETHRSVDGQQLVEVENSLRLHLPTLIRSGFRKTYNVKEIGLRADLDFNWKRGTVIWDLETYTGEKKRLEFKIEAKTLLQERGRYAAGYNINLKTADHREYMPDFDGGPAFSGIRLHFRNDLWSAVVKNADEVHGATVTCQNSGCRHRRVLFPRLRNWIQGRR
ncbi:hypothetical protein K2X33_00950 [bacterium]|nr:hypothetical protein [bacterium]